jgi:hypothetical protein
VSLKARKSSSFKVCHLEGSIERRFVFYNISAITCTEEKFELQNYSANNARVIL